LHGMLMETASHPHERRVGALLGRERTYCGWHVWKDKALLMS